MRATASILLLKKWKIKPLVSISTSSVQKRIVLGKQILSCVCEHEYLDCKNDLKTMSKPQKWL